MQLSYCKIIFHSSNPHSWMERLRFWSKIIIWGFKFFSINGGSVQVFGVDIKQVGVRAHFFLTEHMGKTRHVHRGNIKQLTDWFWRNYTNLNAKSFIKLFQFCQNNLLPIPFYCCFQSCVKNVSPLMDTPFTPPVQWNSPSSKFPPKNHP